MIATEHDLTRGTPGEAKDHDRSPGSWDFHDGLRDGDEAAQIT